MAHRISWEKSERSRALRLAFAASIGLHLALLAGVPDSSPPPHMVAHAPLNARLLAPLAPALPDAPLVTQTTAASPPTRRSQSAATPQSSAPRRVAAAPAAQSPAPQAAESSHPSTSLAETPSRAVEAETAAVARAQGEATLAPRAGDDALDPGSLAQFRIALLGIAKRYKLYPPYAAERGWQGRVGVRLEVGADGTLVAASVQRSSGHELLDREALDVLKKASALTPIPPALRSREFSLEVPVLFELQEG